MTSTSKGAIKIELTAMFDADQAMRRAWETGAPWDVALDRKHTARVKELLTEMGGWPRLSEWGGPATNHLWLLVQHADHDVAFQRECLEMMKSMPLEEIVRTDLAYLTDRVRMNEGRPQLYGSQMRKNAEGRWEAYDLEDAEHVDERRAAAGLEPLAEYIYGANAAPK